MTVTSSTRKTATSRRTAAKKAVAPATPKAVKTVKPKTAARPKTQTAVKPATQPAVKPVTPTVAKPKAAAPAKPAKEKKVKVVRDSFTIPKSELLQVAEMKKRALTLGVGVKKSELIRAGLSALTSMNDAAFKKALASVPTIKTGRPAKD
ncbi:MAG: hypothetical protein RIT44_442 [Pseudomonadota bacterium]|jgi:hypothetical protein